MKRRIPKTMEKMEPTSSSPPSAPHGIFSGMIVLFMEKGVQNRRLQIWKQKLVQMGAAVQESMSKNVTHIFAMDLDSVLQQVGQKRLEQFKGAILRYQWIEDSLKSGERVTDGSYILERESGQGSPNSSCGTTSLDEERTLRGSQPFVHKKVRHSPATYKEAWKDTKERTRNSSDSSRSLSAITSDTRDKDVTASDVSSHYKPPDLNKNITEIFGKLINIYRALGDDRRSFSYYKAIPVIEKLPFKVRSVEQVKHLSAIGKSMQDHIHEIVTTGKLSKLQHFQTDEKVRTISMFGEVWGIGPATALKLYEKGYRTLEELKSEDSLTNSQRLGLKYFDDIKTRIQRDEVQEIECFLQKTAEDMLPGVVVVCGGSFRRGRASCGDMDIVITHSDGNRRNFYHIVSH